MELQTRRFGEYLRLGVIVVLVLYALSFGPVQYLLVSVEEKFIDNSGWGLVWAVFLGFYYPLLWLCDNVEFVFDFYEWYIGQFWMP